ncbi:MAG: hypothetical protein ABIY90_05870 [Puia sp.]
MTGLITGLIAGLISGLMTGLTMVFVKGVSSRSTGLICFLALGTSLIAASLLFGTGAWLAGTLSVIIFSTFTPVKWRVSSGFPIPARVNSEPQKIKITRKKDRFIFFKFKRKDFRSNRSENPSL